jgi:hypothetical protein
MLVVFMFVSFLGRNIKYQSLAVLYVAVVSSSLKVYFYYHMSHTEIQLDEKRKN